MDEKKPLPYEKPMYNRLQRSLLRKHEHDAFAHRDIVIQNSKGSYYAIDVSCHRCGEHLTVLSGETITEAYNERETSHG